MAMEQIIYGGTGGNAPSAGTTYAWPPVGNDDSGIDIATGVLLDRSAIIPLPGTIKDLEVHPENGATGDPGGPNDEFAITVRIDDSDTALSVTWDGSPTPTFPQTSASEVAVTAGQRVSVGFSRSASASNDTMRWSFVFTPTTAKQSILLGCGGGISLNTGSTRYRSIHGRATPTTTEAVHRTYFNIEGAIKSIYVEHDQAPGTAASGKAWDYTIRLNGADTVGTFQIFETAVSGSWTGTIDVEPDDYITIEADPTSTPTTGVVEAWGLGFEADVDGEWPEWLQNTGDPSTSAEQHGSFNSGWKGANWQRQEFVGRADQNTHFLTMKAYAEVAPGAAEGSEQWTVDLQENETPTALGVVILADATEAEDTSEFTPTANQYFSIGSLPANTPAAGRIYVAFKMGDAATLAGGPADQEPSLVGGKLVGNSLLLKHLVGG